MSMLNDHTGKKSPKRVWGNRFCWVALVMAIVDLLPHFEANETIVLYLLGSGTTLLGITVIEHLKPKE